MKDLKSIWNKLNDLQFEEVESLDNVNAIFLRLEREEQLKKKYTFWIVLLILIMMALFSWLIYFTEGVFGLNQKIGIGLITAGSLLIVYFSQLVKIPLNEYQYQQTSLEFLSIVKDKLSARKRFLIIGISFQLVLLMAGLHLLIFPNYQLVSGSKLGIHYGTMFAFFGFGIGVTIVLYNAYYKPILKKIKNFMNK